MQAGTGVNAVAFSPDGQLLVGGGADGAIKVWNSATAWPAGSGTDWVILIPSVIGIALAALAAAITTRAIWLARGGRASPGRTLWKSCW